MDPFELEYINGILEKNKDKEFVDRILNPDKYPRLDLGNGDYATHKMAWGKVGDKYIVHPTVLLEDGKLKEYSPLDAWKRVQKSGDYIEFNNPEEADWFSRRYKKIWEK